VPQDKPESRRVPAAPHTDDPRWLLAQRVAAAPEFHKSARLRDFLLYVCERALAGSPDEITEQQVGVHVFGRHPGYDPGEDNIVRSQARLLRHKLEQYFLEEGRGERYAIVIPKGTYIPVFEVRGPAGALLGPAPGRGQTLTVRLLAATVVLLAGACLFLALHPLRPNAPPAQSEAFALLWNSLFSKDRQTLIVTADLTHVLLQEAARHNLTGSEYFAEGYPKQAQRMAEQSGLDKLLPGVAGLRLTAVSGLVPLLRMPQAVPERLQLLTARQLAPKDFLDSNVILLGGRRANPWVELFDEKLSFRCEWDMPAGGGRCRNLLPQKGELADYLAESRPGLRVSYAGLAYVSTPNRRGSALVVAGEPAVGLQFITREGVAAPWLEQLRGGTLGAPPHFEVLLRIRSNAQQGAAPEIVAFRRLAD